MTDSVPKKDKTVDYVDSPCPDLKVGGIGIDIADVSRMRARLTRQPELIEALLTPDEIAVCLAAIDPAADFATRFALKEAFLKAIGTGWQYGIEFREIQTTINAAGDHRIQLTGKAAELAQKRGVRAIHATVSGAGDLALATVIVEVLNGKG